MDISVLQRQTFIGKPRRSSLMLSGLSSNYQNYFLMACSFFIDDDSPQKTDHWYKAIAKYCRRQNRVNSGKKFKILVGRNELLVTISCLFARKIFHQKRSFPGALKYLLCIR